MTSPAPTHPTETPTCWLDEFEQGVSRRDALATIVLTGGVTEQQIAEKLGVSTGLRKGNEAVSAVLSWLVCQEQDQARAVRPELAKPNAEAMVDAGERRPGQLAAGGEVNDLDVCTDR